MIGSVIGGAFKSWMEVRKVKQEGRIAIAQAQIEQKSEKIKAETSIYQKKQEMDLASMTDMKYGWKDEYLVILLSVPIIMAFIPQLAPFALEGFGIISQMPAWYKWAFTGMVAATFGLRTWAGFGGKILKK
jgi:hypothetical protein